MNKWIKRSLFLTFAAACGSGYHFYLTREDITAKVNSVEGNIVNTDQGVFYNDPSMAYGKDHGRVSEYNKLLTPGNTVILGVYGARPKIGNLSIDDFHFHRNIASVRFGEIVEAVTDTIPKNEGAAPRADSSALSMPDSTMLGIPHAKDSTVFKERGDGTYEQAAPPSFFSPFNGQGEQLPPQSGSFEDPLQDAYQRFSPLPLNPGGNSRPGDFNPYQQFSPFPLNSGNSGRSGGLLQNPYKQFFPF